MSWKNIHVDDYGWVGKVTIKQDGTAIDISSYTTLQYIFKAPDGTTDTKTAGFDTDGTDGILAYTTVDGDVDQAGSWGVQARISKTGAILTADKFKFVAKQRMD